ncbi:MAG: hypothetical protein QW165_05280 [Candidatus Woesearchaeota archaeon]
MSGKQSSLVKEVQRYWNLKALPGMKKVAMWGDKHPASAVPDMLHRWNGLIAQAGIGKAEKFEIGFEERPAPAEKHCKIGNCLICGTPIRYGTRVSVVINGRKLNFGEVGDLVGEECFDHMTYIAEAVGSKTFKMYKADNRQREKGYEKLAKATMTLRDLSPKVVKKLQKQGFDLDSRILAEVADDVQKKVMAGDLSAVKYEIDKGKTRDIIGWAIANKEKIYDPDVRYTVALLAQRPDLVKPEQWAAFLMYQWQERPLKTTGELGGVKEDILYLAGLPSDAAVVQKYGKVDLKKVVEPVKAFSRARWEDVKLGELLEREAVTKAQSRAVKATVPYFRERRECHNREIINNYCTPDEFNKILVKLKEKVDAERRIFAAAKAKGMEEPAMPWKKDTWKALRDFFELEEKVQRTDNTVTTRDVFLNYIFMENADSVARTLYVEGKKAELAKQKGDDVLGREYSTVREAKIDAEKLDKLVSGAIGFDQMPKWLKKKVKETGMSAKTVKMLVEDIKETYSAGLVPTRYVQPDGKKASMLERAVAITADFVPDDGSIAKDISYLKQLETELGVKIASVRAEDGRASTRKSDAKFSIAAYEGRKYFSKEQKTALQNLMQILPSELKNLDVQKTKVTIAFVKQFHAKHDVRTNYSPHGQRLGWGDPGSVEFRKEEMPREWGASIRYTPVKWFIEEEERIKSGKHYSPINAEMREKLLVLNSERARRYHRYGVRLPGDLDKILSNGNTLLSPDLVKAIETKFKEYTDRIAVIEQARQELKAEGYDIQQMAERLERLKKRDKPVRLPDKDYRYSSAPSIDEAIRDLTNDLAVPDKNYIKRLGDAIKPANFVISEGKHLYQNNNMKYFDVIAECALTDSDHADHRLRKTFGPKHNNGKAILKWTPERREFGNMVIEPGEQAGAWYGRGRNRAYVDKLCERAEQEGDVYIRIVGARK